MQSFAIRDAGTARPFPPELKRWNWAAFGLNWIWGLAHRSYFPLLVFVPFFGLVVPFIAGVQGNRWAWENQAWESTDAFRRAQRRWARYTLVAYGAGICAVMVFIAATVFSLRQSGAYELVDAELRADPRIVQALGSPLQTGFPRGNISVGGAGGSADLQLSVTGPRAHGTAYATCRKFAGSWSIVELQLVLDDGRAVLPPRHEASPLGR